MSYLELLPEDLINVLCEYLKSDMMKLIGINQIIDKNINKILRNIKSGNVDPVMYFKEKIEQSSILDNLRYPIEAFIDHEGYWSINNKENPNKWDDYRLGFIAENKNVINWNIEHLFVKKLLEELSETHYLYQEGIKDGDEWIIISKIKEYYVYLEAGCCYTGFDVGGSGSVGYSKDWKHFYNFILNEGLRRMLLIKQDYMDPLFIENI